MSKSHYIIPVFVPDLGCSHQCIFCNQKKITGQNTAPTEIEVTDKILDYLETIPQTPGIIREVAFYGGSFTAVDLNLQRKLLKSAYRFLVNGQIDGIRISTRPDALSDEKMAILAAYGVKTIEIGVQSMDDTVLKKAGRGHTSRDVLRAASLVKTWGMELGFQIIMGLPGDTDEKETNSAWELIGLKPDMMRIYPCLVLKGTQLEELYQAGRYIPLSLDEAVKRCKKLLIMFESAGIKVIRIGLQPSEQINLEGDVLAGPYHPAFRELVESAVARDMVEYLVAGKISPKGSHAVKVLVSDRDVSVVRGNRGRNVEYFKAKYGVTEFRTIADPGLSRGVIKLMEIDGKSCLKTVDRRNMITTGDQR